MSSLDPLNRPAPDAPLASLDAISDWTLLFLKLRDRKRQIEEQMAEAREMIAQHIEEQGGEFGTIAGKPVVRWRSMETNRFNTKKFREAHPELAAEFTDKKIEQRMEVIGNGE